MRKPYEPELFHTAPPERPSMRARGALPRLSGGRQRMA